MPAPEPARTDHDDEADMPLDLGDLPDVTPGRIAVAMPKSRAHRIPRDVRLELEEHEGEKAARQARQARRGDVRAGVLVRHDPVDLTHDVGVPGLWSVFARGQHPSSWAAVPWDETARRWAADHDVSTIDADVLMLAPVR